MEISKPKTIDIELLEREKGSTHFIGKIVFNPIDLKVLNSTTKRELYIFSHLITKNEKVNFVYRDVTRLEFTIVEKHIETQQTITHSLAQFVNANSCLYQSKTDIKITSSECADMVSRKDILYLDRLPKWKVSEGEIPMYDNTPFYFCTQCFGFVPNGEIADEVYYIFIKIKEDDQLLIQIHTQDISQQTAEQHYKLEEDIAVFNKNYNNTTIVEKLIKNGDKFLHEYILNHKKTTPQIADVLLKYAKSESFKKQVIKVTNNKS